jgi:hypothetical protein
MRKYFEHYFLVKLLQVISLKNEVTCQPNYSRSLTLMRSQMGYRKLAKFYFLIL